MAYQTKQEIIDNLSNLHPTISRNVNGDIINLTEEERIETIARWADEVYDAQYTLENSTFLVSPEDIRLAIGKEDEAEFSKLIMLLNLSLQQNKVSLNTPINIWDYLKQPHVVTVGRFLEIMADYGMFCYSKRT